MSVFFAMDGTGADRRAAFFLSKTNAPPGAVEIPAARHAELLAAQAEGRRIIADARGYPVLERRSRAVAASVRMRLNARIRREASRRIAQVSPTWRQINDLRDPSETGAIRYARIDAIRAASNAIEELADRLPTDDLTDFPVANHPLWPEFD